MRTFLLTIFLALSLCLYSQESGIKFSNDSTLSQALIKSKEKGKPLFIDCYTVWCGPCKWLAKEVFTQNKVGSFYNDHFINLAFDMETPEGIKIKEKYDIRSYPTLLFLNEKGDVMHRGYGSIPAEYFIYLGETALDSTKNYLACERKIKNGNRSSETINGYLCANRYAQNKDTLLNDYFFTVSSEERISQGCWDLFCNFINEIDHSQFQYVMANKNSFEHKYGQANVNYKLSNVFEYNINEYYTDSVKMQSLEKLDPTLFKKLISQKEFQTAYSIFLNDKTSKDKWNNFIAKTNNNLPQFESNMIELNNVCWHIYENYKTFNDTLALKQAKEWSHKLCLNYPDDSTINDTYAHVLFELGYIKEAIKYVEIAIIRGKEENSEFQEFYRDELERFKKALH